MRSRSERIGDEQQAQHESCSWQLQLQQHKRGQIIFGTGFGTSCGRDGWHSYLVGLARVPRSGAGGKRMDKELVSVPLKGNWSVMCCLLVPFEKLLRLLGLATLKRV